MKSRLAPLVFFEEKKKTQGIEKKITEKKQEEKNAGSAVHTARGSSSGISAYYITTVVSLWLSLVLQSLLICWMVNGTRQDKKQMRFIYST